MTEEIKELTTETQAVSIYWKTIDGDVGHINRIAFPDRPDVLFNHDVNSIDLDTLKPYRGFECKYYVDDVYTWSSFVGRVERIDGVNGVSFYDDKESAMSDEN